jgi:hypothetical protein
MQLQINLYCKGRGFSCRKSAAALLLAPGGRHYLVQQGGEIISLLHKSVMGRLHLGGILALERADELVHCLHFSLESADHLATALINAAKVGAATQRLSRSPELGALAPPTYLAKRAFRCN